METIVLPALRRFDPELVLISAGFDAHRDDPLADMGLDESDFAWGTQAIRAAAPAAQGRIVSTLEGGYNLTALAVSARAHVLALMTAA
jgi:acetoin utilization deacetylase AcuC-like enzyme